ncbi:MAG: hypothetical protein M3R22_13295 [Pseudomonadota bacterium]|nr:hypothetical protein [Pseudomonadota bacterium]
MATNVLINKFAVKSIFDSKYKSDAADAMKAAAADALSSKLKLVSKIDKGTKGYTIDGSLVSLAPDKAGKMLEAVCSLAISNDHGIQATAKGSAAAPITSVAKLDKDDVKAAVVAAVGSGMKSAVKYMEGTPP